MFATQGAGGNEEHRMRQFLADFEALVWPYPRQQRWKNFWKLVQAIRSERPDLVIMEGTGFPGGLALLCCRWFGGVPFVFSSGDAVGPFLGLRNPIIGWLGQRYEKLLYRNCKGFIGWTPYLVGRALSFGAKRCMTAPGFAPYAQASDQRAQIRQRYKIDPNAIVIGIAGALIWNPRVKYCYGMELVQAIRHATIAAGSAQGSRKSPPNVAALIIGDGTGVPHLQAAAGDLLGKSVFLTGRLAQQDLPAHFAAMDFGSLPQSLDQVGSFRFTTKISEYLGSNLPVVTGRTPFAYDYGEDWIIRLCGNSPWDPAYIAALSRLLCQATPEKVAKLRESAPASLPVFDLPSQKARVTRFISELCETN
jgi:glycosyltransferase involved in cell wall biosynthesis